MTEAEVALLGRMADALDGINDSLAILVAARSDGGGAYVLLDPDNVYDVMKELKT